MRESREYALTDSETTDSRDEEREPDFIEKRGFTWGLLVGLLLLTLVVAIMLAYLITVRNFPAH